MRVEKFEDLVAWQKARELTKEIYQITRQGIFSKDYGLSEQIRRASVSVILKMEIEELKKDIEVRYIIET